MKKCFRAIFILLGSIVGAGFVSGAEICRFFPLPDPIYAIVCALAFFVGLCLVLRAGSVYGSFSCLLRGIFGRFAIPVRVLFLLASFIVCVAMLAGINALCPAYAPYVSLLCALLCFLLAERGKTALGVLNLILVPCIFVFLAVQLFSCGAFSCEFSTVGIGKRTVFTLLYVAMNVFLSAPVAVDCGEGMQKGEIICTAGVCSLLLGGFIFFLRSAIGGSAGASQAEMPLLFLLKESGVYPFIVFAGILTTLIASVYPLQRAIQKPIPCILFGVLASVCALFGFSATVEYAYPALGVLGILFLIAVGIHRPLFQKSDQKIHYPRQHAQNHGRRHH